MKGKGMVGVGLGVLAVVTGVAVLAVSGPAVLYSARAQVTDDVVPEDVVVGFYDWYLGGIDLQAGRNPLVEWAYRSSEFLSEDVVAEADTLLDAFQRGVYDPFLLAQDVPAEIAVGEAELVGDEARVPVEMFWGGNSDPSERTVTLQRIDGAWKIVEVAFPDTGS